jgi:hypothetical protein
MPEAQTLEGDPESDQPLAKISHSLISSGSDLKCTEAIRNGRFVQIRIKSALMRPDWLILRITPVLHRRNFAAPVFGPRWAHGVVPPTSPDTP